MTDSAPTGDARTAPAERGFFRAVELAGTGVHPASWRRADSRAEELFTAAYWLDAITAAERAGLDAVLVPDSFEAGPSGAGAVRGRLDAVAVTARAAARTTRVGLIPQITTTHTEPFHVSKAVQALDFATHGRAGWEIAVSEGAAQAKAFGRKEAQDTASLWQEAEEAIEVVTRLWDSWEDDAEIRDLSTGRFIDRDKLHYIDFAGAHFSVKGPSITPRSPQGQPIVVIRGDAEPAATVAARRADLIRIAAPTPQAARAKRAALRGAARAAGRDLGALTVLLDIDIHLAETEAAAQAEVAQLDGWSARATAETELATLRHLGTVATLNELLADLAGSGAADGVVLRPLAVAAATRLLAAPITPARDASGQTTGAPADSGAPDSGPFDSGPFDTTRSTLRDRLGLARPAAGYATITEGVPS